MDPAFFGVFLFVLASFLWILVCSNAQTYLNIMDYGATRDGSTDDSQAFVKAWSAACSAEADFATLYVPPGGAFLVNPITFEGPCKAPIIHFLIPGTILAPESPSAWKGKETNQWLRFMTISGLHIDGFGVVDGQGKAWWDQSCRYHPDLENCTSLAPTALSFLECNQSSIRNTRLTNTAQTHILVEGSNDILVENVVIDSPGDSPNTDGIHIHSSQQIRVTDSNIACGDDCISIGDYVADIEIGNIRCGPGHGISIGSLGKGGNTVDVHNINVSYAYFNGTTNGARIKTWQVGSGHVRDIVFENLVFYNVSNPVIIDQNYCDVRNACPELETGVQISNVTYRVAAGTSASDIAINLNCSKTVPCSGIYMESIVLSSAKAANKQVTANCSNVQGQQFNVVPGQCFQE